MPRARVIAFLFFVLGTPSAARAQIDAVTKFFDRIEDVTLFYTIGRFSPASSVLTTGKPAESVRSGDLQGFGIEVSFDVGGVGNRGGSSETDAGQGKHPPPTSEARQSELACFILDSLPSDSTKATADLELKEVKVSCRTPYGVVESTFTPKPKQSDTDNIFDLEVAFGYSQFSGFALQDPAFDLHGAVRELPSVSAYLSYLPESDQAWSVYLGVHTGLAQLYGVQARDTLTSVLYSANTNTTFQAGISLGGFVSIGEDFHLFAEPGYYLRKFPTVEWKPVSNTVPAGLPAELKFNGFVLALGAQVHVGKIK